MKPFTLEWYWYQFEQAKSMTRKYAKIDRVEGSKKNFMEYSRYWRLALWIRERALKKYGESE